MRTRAAKPKVGLGLTHPVAIAAIVLLLLNDHWFKHAWPSPLTGKLSDFAGLIFFPLFLHAIYELSRGVFRPQSKPSAKLLLGCVLVTGLVFASVNLWSPATQAYEVALGWLQWAPTGLIAALSGAESAGPYTVAMTPDPTDLVALPALLVPLWLSRKAAYEPAVAEAGRYC